MTQHKSVDGAVADLAALLAAVDVQQRRASRRMRRNETNRLNLLYVHAGCALLAAPLFAANYGTFGSASWRLLRLIPGFPVSFALVLLLGGLILLPATVARHARLEMVGLGLINLWYTGMAVGFLIPAVEWALLALPAIFASEPMPGNQPGLYAWVIYGGYSVILRVHLWTLWRMRRDDRAKVETTLEAPR